MAAAQPSDNGGTELGRFLRARRSQVSPADVGFAPGPGVRYDAMVLLDMTAPAPAEGQPRSNNDVTPKERTDW
jgi:hypothetical protein